MTGERARWPFRLAFASLTALTVAALWSVELLPFVDLPQHEALISILARWNDPACGYPALYELRPLTPYWLGYAVAWALAAVVDVATATRITLALALVAIPWATLRLVREQRGDDFWVLAVFPLLFGFPVVWGFFTFLVAAPLVLLFGLVAERYARSPSPGRGAGIALFALLLFAAHALAFAFAMLLFAATVAVAAPGWRAAFRRLWPAILVAPLPLAWAWRVARARGEGESRNLYLFGPDRLLDLPAQWTGIDDRWLAALALGGLLATLFAAGARLTRDPSRRVGVALAAAIVLFGPNMAGGTAYLAPRFVIFLLPLLLFACDRQPRAAGLAARRLALAALAALLAIGAAARLRAIDREGAGLAELLAAAPDGRRLLYLPLARSVRGGTTPHFVHSGSRYLLGRCGSVEPSFVGRYDQLPLRLLASAPAPLPERIETLPHLFRWERHGGDTFDLILVRSHRDPDPRALAGGEGRLEPVARAGSWWLYRRVAARRG